MLEAALSAGKRLVTCAFQVTRAVLVNSAAGRETLWAASARMSRQMWEEQGWREQMPSSESYGRGYFWNLSTFESCWQPPDVWSSGLPEKGIGALSGGGWLSGLPVVFLWAPISEATSAAIARSGMHAATLMRDRDNGSGGWLVGSPSIESAVGLAVGAGSIEGVAEGGFVELVGVWCVLGREGIQWGRGEMGSVWVQDEDSVCPWVCVGIKRLVRTDKPEMWPPAGVHEGEVIVSMSCS